MNSNDYLKRINCETKRDVSLENLKYLQKQHLSTIPFENLNVTLRQKVTMNIESVYSKVINNNRGGFCFELNQLFAWLLKELGYQIKLVGCRVFQVVSKTYTPWLAHIAILVQLNQNEYLVDVGFSSCYQSPIEFISNKIQFDLTGKFKLNKTSENFFTLLRNTTNSLNEEDWAPIYEIDSKPRHINEFDEMLEWVQSPECPRFYNRSLSIKHIETGFLMLIGYRLTRIEFQNSVEIKRSDVLLETKQQVYETLRREFDLKFDFEFEPIDLVG